MIRIDDRRNDPRDLRQIARDRIGQESRALDEDGNLTAQTGVASNGFGLVGRIVGLAAGSRNLAAGIGFYAAGLSIYDNFLHAGSDVIFPKDTRIEIETTPLRAPVLTPGNE